MSYPTSLLHGDMNNNMLSNMNVSSGSGSGMQLSSADLPPAAVLSGSPEAADGNVLRALFGGALQCAIPKRFDDISAVRQVPDHQEVFSDADSDQSIIIELNSYVDHTECAEPNIAAYYMDDLAQVNEATHCRMLVPQSALTQGELPLIEAPLPKYYCIAEQHVSKFKEQARNTIQIYMAIIRLQQVKTDILLTFNIPTAFAADR